MNENAGAKTGPELTPVHRVEMAISHLLRIGVMSSMALVVIGAILSYAHNPAWVKDRMALQPLLHGSATEKAGAGYSYPTTVGGVIGNIKESKGRGLVVLGLLVLIATPVLRVAVSIVAFGIQKDRMFVLITLTVLVLLLISFALGRAEG